MNTAIQNDLNATKQAEIKQTEELLRIINNNLALLESNDVLVPASHARALPEITNWLRYMVEKMSATLAELKPKADVASVGTEQDK